ncbi:hypothetical protein H257_04032 [Aphanomyces astaci]|uniref:Uncharacterized protein n=1 Tax=Aphanomyces astaci TaxID=112090 RepID=W4GU98_APHAT|nr:hypothetical protein H257_04032 [Aphanomyces astaci]ETV83262.1 hypothetical protein H257_04032 [Aphanomyces astaci]|eukprot:XP_009826692.1 hypothetical protein H257_04032 [Aphanomyces astaci]
MADRIQVLEELQCITCYDCLYIDPGHCLCPSCVGFMTRNRSVGRRAKTRSGTKGGAFQAAIASFARYQQLHHMANQSHGELCHVEYGAHLDDRGRPRAAIREQPKEPGLGDEGGKPSCDR